jgi:hypothetical protein
LQYSNVLTNYKIEHELITGKDVSTVIHTIIK